ncbi:MAG: hypothetical protein N3D78_03220, partial [Candidatus Aenigmarchaeota archaeon]|nr:hypothetical protein [Candidatus Aenigmarchaeota archaeon]
VCYKKCEDTKAANEVYIMTDDTQNTCIYCPADRPKYDPTTKACIRESSVATIRVGNCATLSTQLPVAFTDITFADANNNPISTADYVAVGYSCAA